MSRTGKIARLPSHIRDALNQRIEDGAKARSLVRWLNSLPEVKAVTSADFDGRPINEQNLSDWKQGGFLDWQRRQQVSERVHHLVERSAQFEAAGDDLSIPDRLATVLGAELAAEAQRLLDETAEPAQRWRYLRQALRHLHLLRRGDHWAARARMESVRWQIECEEREYRRQVKEMDDAFQYVMRPIHDATRRAALVDMYGGGEKGAQAADFILEMERKYRVQKFPLGLSTQNPPSPASPDPAPPPPAQPEIKPNQGKSS